MRGSRESIRARGSIKRLTARRIAVGAPHGTEGKLDAASSCSDSWWSSRAQRPRSCSADSMLRRSIWRCVFLALATADAALAAKPLSTLLVPRRRKRGPSRSRSNAARTPSERPRHPKRDEETALRVSSARASANRSCAGDVGANARQRRCGSTRARRRSRRSGIGVPDERVRHSSPAIAATTNSIALFEQHDRTRARADQRACRA